MRLPRLLVPCLCLALGLALPAFAGPSPTQGDIYLLDGKPTGDLAPVAWQASQFEVWGRTKKGLSMLPGGASGFVDLGAQNFGRGGQGVDSQDWRNARTTITATGKAIRTIYVRVQDGVDYGDLGIKARGRTAIGVQTIAPVVMPNQGPAANRKNQYFAVSFHRPVAEATLTFFTRNETGRKRANGFQVEVLASSDRYCPDRLIDDGATPPDPVAARPATAGKARTNARATSAASDRSSRRDEAHARRDEAHASREKRR